MDDMTNQGNQPVTNPDPNAVPAQPAATPPADAPVPTPPATDDGGMADVKLPGEETPATTPANPAPTA